MNWNFIKTTSSERAIISDATYELFADLERAEMLLNTVLNEDFSDRVQQPITEGRAEWIGAMLWTISDIISDVVLAYKLTVADTEDPRACLYIEAAERVKTAIECEKAHEAAFAQLRKLPKEMHDARISERVRLKDLEDSEALREMADLMQC